MRMNELSSVAAVVGTSSPWIGRIVVMKLMGFNVLIIFMAVVEVVGLVIEIIVMRTENIASSYIIVLGLQNTVRIMRCQDLQ